MDPIHHSSLQTEFRFKPNTAYLSNLRLANLGVTVATAAAYNPLVGAASNIASIHLFDGNQMLDQILEFPQWAGFSSFNRPNQKNVDAQKVLARTGLGYNYSESDYPDANGTDNEAHAKIEQHFVPGNANSTAATTAKGWLSLKSILPFLDNSAYLPTSIFKNLRLVIQYSNAKNTTVNNNQLPTTLEPMLIADEVLDPNKQSSITNSYKGVQFQAIEHDRVYLNAFVSGGSSTQEQTFTIGGFDNKRVGRIVVVNSLTDTGAIDSDVATVGLGSQSQPRQKIQLRVNGQSKFWQSGISRPMERLAKLTDTWGTMNAFPGSSDVGVLNSTNVISSSITQYVSRFDYFGCSVGDEVLEFQIDYSRDFVDDAKFKTALQLNIFAEVLKTVSIGNGGYTIAYA
jgi:hypothetical protein